MPKVSIIVPCNNIEPWLGLCMDNLVGQTLDDIEILCIDDKSTDDTLKLLKQYAKKDERIKIISHKKNMGVAAARNDGLRIATGQYIGFVDPDDFVDKDFYEKLYNKAIETEADVVKGGVVIVDLQTGKKTVKKDKIKHVSEFSEEFWSAIYRRDFLEHNDIKFNKNLIIGEDTLFLTEVCLKVEKISFVTDTYYNYFYQRPGSLDSRVLSHRQAESIYESVLMRLQLLDKSSLHKKDLDSFFDRHIMSQIIYNIFKNFEQEIDRRKLFEMLVMIHKKYGMKKVLVHRFRKARFNFIRKEDYRSFVNFSSKRFYLFNFLPIVLIEYRGKKTYIKLFDIIPIIKIK